MLSSSHKIILAFVLACSVVLVFSLLFLQNEEEGLISRQLREDTCHCPKENSNPTDSPKHKIEQKETEKVVLQEHQHEPLDLEDLPNLVGPRPDPVATNKTLVAICIGKSDKENVNKLVQHFPPPRFTLMLFHYDDSSWDEFPWYKNLNVVAIRVLHKMKYWYVKRFIHPELARGFSHIIILDADVSFSPETFNAPLYLSIVDAYDIALSQPSHDWGSVTAHAIVQSHGGDMIGRYTDFVECGPAVVLSQKGYQCVYNLLQSDLTSGWGLDLKWANWVRFDCGLGNKSVAVIDMQNLHHALASGKGTASSNPGFNDGAWKEYYAYRDRFNSTPSTEKIEIGENNGHFGSRVCVGKNTTFPLECLNAPEIST